jgi:transcriptional regulator with XRE-family HTH domain
MSENTSGAVGGDRPGQDPAVKPPGAAQPHPGDIGRRLALRRKQLGVTREETAARAGMAPSYLEYLETRPGEFGTGGLLRLAAALDTSLTELLGGETDLPPGRARAAAGPKLEVLEAQECWGRLAQRGVGRVAFSTLQGPVVIPVNYRVVDRTVVYRTAPGTVSAGAVGHRVAFEVDQVDDALSQGWSVLVVGPADHPAEADRPQEGHGPTPWAGGPRDLLVRISPDTVSGRIIRTQGHSPGAQKPAARP